VLKLSQHDLINLMNLKITWMIIKKNEG
jgi:hypothetical protein